MRWPWQRPRLTPTAFAGEAWGRSLAQWSLGAVVALCEDLARSPLGAGRSPAVLLVSMAQAEALGFSWTAGLQFRSYADGTVLPPAAAMAALCERAVAAGVFNTFATLKVSREEAIVRVHRPGWDGFQEVRATSEEAREEGYLDRWEAEGVPVAQCLLAMARRRALSLYAPQLLFPVGEQPPPAAVGGALPGNALESALDPPQQESSPYPVQLTFERPLLSPEQQADLQLTAGQRGWSAQQLSTLLNERCGVASMSEVKACFFETLLALILRGPSSTSPTPRELQNGARQKTPDRRADR